MAAGTENVDRGVVRGRPGFDCEHQENEGREAVLEVASAWLGMT